jgi:SAM-dependent methyltransferase
MLEVDLLILDEKFYENYGREWAMPLRAAHEELCSQYKLENWLEVIPSSVTVKSFIDFGCGNGVFLNLFSQSKKIKGIGIDISHSMIETAHQKFPEHTFIVGDINTFVKNKLFTDIVFLNDVLEHLSNPSNYLVWLKDRTKYIAIRIPLEKTWLISILNSLHLKKPMSRLYFSEGHLFELNESEVCNLVEEAGLTIISKKIVNDTRKIVFHPYIRERMKAKAGLPGAARYLCYRLMEKIPYNFTQSILRPLKGSTLVALCRTNNTSP